MIWRLAIWFAFIYVHAYRDYELIEIKKQKPVYRFSFLYIRLPAGIAWLFLWPWHGILYEINYIVFEVTSFWCLFPLILNKLRGKEPFYLGRSSGWFDTHFIRHPVQFRAALILTLILCIFSVIVIYQR